jgi:hypothetical protein
VKILGAALIALPFVGLFALSVKWLGWKIGWMPLAFVAAVWASFYFGMKLVGIG